MADAFGPLVTTKKDTEDETSNVKSILSLQTITLLTAVIFANPSSAREAKANHGGQIRLLSSSPESIVIRVTVGDVARQSVRTPIGDSFVLRTGRGTSPLNAGTPDIGTMATSLIIPDRVRMNGLVLSSEFEEIPNIRIASSKGSISRNIDPS